jgi:hypothetical protein
MRSTCAAVIVLLTLAWTPARAESLFGQSRFGAPASMADARTEGRGGAGLAYRDSISANVASSLQLPDLRRVSVSLTTWWGNNAAEDASGKVTRWDITNPTVRVGLPLGRFGFGTGFEARRSAQWTVVREAEASPDPTEPFTETLEREGTLFDFPFELGVRVSEHLRLGAGLLLVRGTVRQRYRAVVPGAGSDPSDVREDVYEGEALRLAAGVYDLGPLSAAAYYVPQHDADVEVRVRGVSRDSRRDSRRTDTLPARLGAGVRFDLPGRWSLGTDYRWEEWSAYRGRTSYEGELVDEWSLHVGVEREEEGRGRRRSAPLRVGGWYRRYHYQLGGADLTEWGASVGTAIALKGLFSRADLALQYGRTGSLADNGAQESFFRLVFSITGGEKWY